MKTVADAHFVEVAVDGVLPGPDSLTLTYSSQREVEPGSLIWVPLRKSVALGVAIECSQRAPDFEVKPILDVVAGFSMSADQIDLATWLCRATASDLFSCLELMLPPGAKISVTPGLSCDTEATPDLPGCRSR